MRASGYERAASDWYVEPRWIVDALLDAETFVGRCWDPACGSGNIPEAVKARGIECHASEIADRGYGLAGHDFFASDATAHNIISNPPYGVIEAFIRHALALTTGKVAILARLALLEGMKRQALFAETPLARVWVSSKRVSMPPGGTDIEAKGGSVAFAWFVWDHAHHGDATVGFLPKRAVPVVAPPQHAFAYPARAMGDA